MTLCFLFIYLFIFLPPSCCAPGHNKDSGPAAGTAEEDRDFQRAPRNQQDAENGQR